MCQHQLNKKTEEYAREKFVSDDSYQLWNIKFKNARRIRKAQKWQEDPHCHYCGTKLRFDKATYDHVLPQSKNGSEHPDNFVIACEPCNNIRGDMSYNIFYNIVTSVEDRKSYQEFLKTIDRSKIKKVEETKLQRIDRLFLLIKNKREKAKISNDINAIKFCNTWRKFLVKVQEKQNGKRHSYPNRKIRKR